MFDLLLPKVTSIGYGAISLDYKDREEMLVALLDKIPDQNSLGYALKVSAGDKNKQEMFYALLDRVTDHDWLKSAREGAAKNKDMYDALNSKLEKELHPRISAENINQASNIPTEKSVDYTNTPSRGGSQSIHTR